MVFTPNGEDPCHEYSTAYGYDLNGNITSLTRKGVTNQYPVFEYTMWRYGDIDDLTLEYDGNQLRKVTDRCGDLDYAGAMDFKDGANRSVEYSWDANGNMTDDRNKGISHIQYNVLNLPERITYDDGHIVDYIYAADGRKLRVEYLLNTLLILPGLNPAGLNQAGIQSMGGVDPNFDPPRPPDRRIE